MSCKAKYFFYDRPTFEKIKRLLTVNRWLPKIWLIMTAESLVSFMTAYDLDLSTSLLLVSPLLPPEACLNKKKT